MRVFFVNPMYVFFCKHNVCFFANTMCFSELTDVLFTLLVGNAYDGLNFYHAYIFIQEVNIFTWKTFIIIINWI